MDHAELRLQRELLTNMPIGVPVGPAVGFPDDFPIIQADVLRRILTSRDPEQYESQALLFLRKARIVGPLNLGGCRLAARLRLEHCIVDESIYLEQARASDIRFIKCALRGGIEGSQLSVDWNLWLDGSTLNKPVRLSHATIGGQLGMVGTFLCAEPEPETPMFHGDGLQVGNGMYCREGFESLGQIRLVGAAIEGQLDMSNARISCSTGPAILAPELSVSQSFLAGGLKSGAVVLSGARIGGNLAMDGADLRGGGEDALTAGSVTVGGHLECTEGFRASGDVDFSYATINGHLALNDAHLDGELVLFGGTVRTQLGLERATLLASEDADPQVALNADYLHAGGGIHGSGLSTRGQLRLAGADIGGQLNLRGATLDSGKSTDRRPEAIAGQSLRARSGVYCVDGFSARGDLNLQGARIDIEFSLHGALVEEGTVVLDAAFIGQRLSMKGATLAARDSDNAALTAHSIEVGRIVTCDGLHVTGAVIFTSARIDGELSMHGVQLRGPVVLDAASIGGRLDFLQALLDGNGGPALVGRRLSVNGDLRCQDGVGVDGGFGVFKSVGELHLPACVIKGKLIVSGAFLSGSRSVSDLEENVAMSLVDGDVDELILCPDEVDGLVDLSDLRVRSLCDVEDGKFFGMRCERLSLDGFSYAALSEPLDAEQRLAWIEASQVDTHDPKAFIELADAFRRRGRNSDVRRVLIASQRRAYRELKPRAARSTNIPERIGLAARRGWHNLLYVTVGYGYRNWLALGWLFGLLAIGTAVFWIGHASFSPTQEHPPAFQPLLYAIDVTIPVIDLGQQGAWAPGGMTQWVGLALSVGGYALATAVLAAAAGLLRRGEQ
jgi:hypothetical protein